MRHVRFFFITPGKSESMVTGSDEGAYSRRLLTAQGVQQARLRRQDLDTSPFELILSAPSPHCAKTAEEIAGVKSSEIRGIPALGIDEQEPAGKRIVSLLTEIQEASLNAYLSDPRSGLLLQQGRDAWTAILKRLECLDVGSVLVVAPGIILCAMLYQIASNESILRGVSGHQVPGHCQGLEVTIDIKSNETSGLVCHLDDPAPAAA